MPRSLRPCSTGLGLRLFGWHPVGWASWASYYLGGPRLGIRLVGPPGIRLVGPPGTRLVGPPGGRAGWASWGLQPVDGEACVLARAQISVLPQRLKLAVPARHRPLNSQLSTLNSQPRRPNSSARIGASRSEGKSVAPLPGSTWLRSSYCTAGGHGASTLPLPSHTPRAGRPR